MGKLYSVRSVNDVLANENGNVTILVEQDISGKVDKVTSKSLILDTEITRLASVVVHPTNHPPSIITQDATNRFVTDTEKSIWNAKQNVLGYTPENLANKNVASGYAGLGSDGKLITTQLPSITISNTFIVASQALMLAIVCETGDVAVRTDQNKTYILKGTNPTVLGDWQELLTPTSSISSVFGRNGAIVATLGDYDADKITETASRVFITPTQKTYLDTTSSIQTQLNGKEPSILSGTSTQYYRGDKTFQTLDKASVGLPNVPNTDFTNAVGLNTAKVGITTTQSNNITSNNAKVGITTQQASDITSNNAKVGYTEALVSANTNVTANTAKVGITTTQSNNITTNNAKVGITTTQSNNITANNAKISFDSTSSTRLVNTSGINTGDQTLSSLNAAPSSGSVNYIQNGTAQQSANLNISGSGTFGSSVTASAFYQSSDMRLKTIIKRDGDVAYFRWNDNRDDLIHIGYIAQEVQVEFPEQVKRGDDEMLAINYIEVLVARIQELDNRLKQIEGLN
jgi:hypothetical protein